MLAESERSTHVFEDIQCDDEATVGGSCATKFKLSHFIPLNVQELFTGLLLILFMISLFISNFFIVMQSYVRQISTSLAPLLSHPFRHLQSVHIHLVFSIEQAH